MTIEEMTTEQMLDRFDELDEKCPIEDIPEYKALAILLARELRFWRDNCVGD